jgi:hypothetical protein
MAETWIAQDPAESRALPELPKATADSAEEICRRFEASETARAHLSEGSTTPSAFLNALIGAGALVEAVTFLAHALPRREGVWWACQAARTLDLGDEAALARRTVRATEAWVFAPDDAMRRTAMELAEALGLEGAPAWAAVAAFWAGDNLAPADQPAVPPPDYLWCHAVNGSVLLAAAAGPADQVAARQRTLLDQGVDIAAGGTGRTAGTERNS